jgi:hypothetical protein
MSQFIGNGLVFTALLGGLAYGLYVLWRKGKFARIGFLPKPPNQEKS